MKNIHVIDTNITSFTFLLIFNGITKCTNLIIFLLFCCLINYIKTIFINLYALNDTDNIWNGYNTTINLKWFTKLSTFKSNVSYSPFWITRSYYSFYFYALYSLIHYMNFIISLLFYGYNSLILYLWMNE